MAATGRIHHWQDHWVKMFSAGVLFALTCAPARRSGALGTPGVQERIQFQWPRKEEQALNFSGCHLLDQLYCGAVLTESVIFLRFQSSVWASFKALTK